MCIQSKLKPKSCYGAISVEQEQKEELCVKRLDLLGKHLLTG